MAPIADHPLRYSLANELHARPFPAISFPGTAVYLAVKQPDGAAARNREADMTHLLTLLDRYGAPHPQPGATHYFGTLGRFKLKWESHTEFVTYTAFIDGLSARPFDPADFEVFPSDWLEAIPGVRMTSALIRVEPWTDKERAIKAINEWFVPESIAVSKVLDESGVIAGDFRIDEAGHQRFAIFVDPSTGDRRVGRMVQRLCEIETYKTMSMLGFSETKAMSPRMNDIDGRLTELMDEMTDNATPAEHTLGRLLEVSAELETMAARASFRFGATGAYEAIVHQRIEVMREQRFDGRQTFNHNS